MPSSPTRSTCSDHGARPPAGSGLYWPKATEPFASVAISRDPRQPAPGPCHHSRISSRSAQPHRPRRHRLGGVRSDERRQLLDVVALEGIHVPGQQLALRFVARLVQPGVRLLLVVHRGVGALQGTVDAGDRRLEQLGDFAGLPLEHVAQDQHGALLRRQVLQCGDERETDRLALGHGIGGVAGMGGHDVPWRRLDEGALRQGGAHEPIGRS